jgi:hypothetical protein
VPQALATEFSVEGEFQPPIHMPVNNHPSATEGPLLGMQDRTRLYTTVMTVGNI